MNDCLGVNTSVVTTREDLFVQYDWIEYWRYEVIYSYGQPEQRSSSWMDIRVNQSPRNGSCSVSPLNGSTSTLFTLTCSKWIDEDGIKDYSIYGKREDLSQTEEGMIVVVVVVVVIGWKKNVSDRVMLGVSVGSTLEFFLPSNVDVDQNQSSSSLFDLMVGISDRYDRVREVNVSSIVVEVDREEIDVLIQSIESSSFVVRKENPFVQMFVGGDENVINQVFMSLSQHLNQINDQVTSTLLSHRQLIFFPLSSSLSVSL